MTAQQRERQREVFAPASTTGECWSWPRTWGADRCQLGLQGAPGLLPLSQMPGSDGVVSLETESAAKLDKPGFSLRYAG